MAKKTGDRAQLHELLYQALETEIGGIRLYKAAVACAVNQDLHKEWEDYLNETTTHRQVLLSVFELLGLDPETRTPGREVVEHLGASMVRAIEMARQAGDPIAAQRVAAECVVLAETKDHANWELIGLACDHLQAKEAKEAEVLRQAYDAVHRDEDHHLYYTPRAGRASCGSTRWASPP
ncbi:hypothetical protein [Frateuria defendens]|uniref:hypothetical protein n=1 Tax=Frateuria defendens TaxID=2219559 RepID=UPI000AEE4913|nr:hypothetical protein [Frateuria defendens]